jgi:hypothetical protein
MSEAPARRNAGITNTHRDLGVGPPVFNGA